MLDIYNGILLSLRKEGKFTLCDSMDGPGEYYAKWDVSQRKQILYNFTYMWKQMKKIN